MISIASAVIAPILRSKKVFRGQSGQDSGWSSTTLPFGVLSANGESASVGGGSAGVQCGVLGHQSPPPPVPPHPPPSRCVSRGGCPLGARWLVVGMPSPCQSTLPFKTRAQGLWQSTSLNEICGIIEKLRAERRCPHTVEAGDRPNFPISFAIACPSWTENRKPYGPRAPQRSDPDPRPTVRPHPSGSRSSEFPWRTTRGDTCLGERVMPVTWAWGNRSASCLGRRRRRAVRPTPSPHAHHPP